MIIILCLEMPEMAQRVRAGEPAAGSNRVRVAVRLRTYINKQDDKGQGPCVRGLDSHRLELVNWKNATETLHYESVALFSLMGRRL